MSTNHQRLGAMALVGAWGEVDDAVIDAFIADIRAARDRDVGRPVNLIDEADADDSNPLPPPDVNNP